MNILTRLHKYQHERFPLRILVFTTLSSSLVSVAVTGNSADWLTIGALFLVGLFCVFHVRVIDESRDAPFDAENYATRPIQTGLVSIKELLIVDLVGLAITFVLAFLYANIALYYAIIFMLFTTLAWKDFFLTKWFQTRPLLYHIVNSPQMIILQLLIFAMLTGSYVLTLPMILQAVMVYGTIFILELVRKIRITPREHTPVDSYSRTYGFKNALVISACFYLATYITYVFLLDVLIGYSLLYTLLGLLLTCLGIYSLIIHAQKKTDKTEKLMHLGGVLAYVGYNLLVYFSVQ